MPPRAVKRTPTGSGTKRGGRTNRGTPKSKEKQPVVMADEPVKVEVSAAEEEKKLELKQELKAEQPVAEEKSELEKPVKAEPEVKSVEKSKY